jgi:hypothetical protein
VDQTTDLVVLALPKSAYPAMIPILLPKLRVDMPELVKRRHQLIAMAPGPQWNRFAMTSLSMAPFSPCRLRQQSLWAPETASVLRALENIAGFGAVLVLVA